MSLYFLESMKKSGIPHREYNDQLYIILKKENILYLISNIIKAHQESDDKDTFQLGFAGKMEKD